MVSTQISLVRHGVTEWNYAGRVQGRSDIPLAEEGERQAEAAARRLAAHTWDAIYSSPLQRAHRTAMLIAHRVCQSEVLTDPRLAERNMGEAEGLFDPDLATLWPGRAWDDLPGMEPPEHLAARAHKALAEMAARHAGGRVICVSHSSLIRAFLRSLQPPANQGSALTHLRPASITAVLYDGRQFIQVGPPDHGHVLEEGIEYSGEKGRVSAADLMPLLPDGNCDDTRLERVVWGATAIETAWADERLVGFARAFADGAFFGCIDLAAALPDYERVLPPLIKRLSQRYPGTQFVLPSAIDRRQTGP